MMGAIAYWRARNSGSQKSSKNCTGCACGQNPWIGISVQGMEMTVSPLIIMTLRKDEGLPWKGKVTQHLN